MNLDLNALSKEIHADMVKVGWWPEGRAIENKFQMVSTEICEATEGERKDLMDDHLPNRKMGEVELADTLVRVLDIGGHLGLKYFGHAADKFLVDDDPCVMHWEITYSLVKFYEVQSVFRYGMLINQIIGTAEHLGYDIESAMIEKIEYNKTRKDHDLSTSDKKF